MKRMSVGFRTHGSPTVGLGHVRRCLTLAEALRALAAQICFFVNDDPIVTDVIAWAGFEAMTVPDGTSDSTLSALKRWQPEALILDSYDLTADFMATVRRSVKLLVAIDDLADRELPVDIVVNGTINALSLHYTALPTTRFFLGPAYILLRNEFAQRPDRAIRECIEQVLLTIGGSDPHHLTPRLMEWVRETLTEASLDVVVGPFFERTGSVGDVAARYPGRAHIHHNPSYMRDLMVKADLAVAGGGQTTYELAATGTPTIAICVADNQQDTVKGMDAAGTLAFVGDAGDPNLETVVKHTLRRLAADPTARKEMSRKGLSVIDGQGASRVAQVILQAIKQEQVQ
jgi:UDP-2,4-diacetamido-2,4,6-trideoxy-beta-L-altropyranose hydrolase